MENERERTPEEDEEEEELPDETTGGSVEEDEEEEVEEVVEAQQPLYTVDQVQGMVRNILQKANAQQEAERIQAELDALADADPAKYVAVTRQMNQMKKDREEMEAKVATDYYTAIFRDVLGENKEILQMFTPQQKDELNPDNPKWQSDGQYLNALVGAIADKKAELRAQQLYTEFQEDNNHQLQEVVVSNNAAKTAVNLPPATSETQRNPLTMGSKEGLATALKEVVGAGWDKDDSD